MSRFIVFSALPYLLVGCATPCLFFTDEPPPRVAGELFREDHGAIEYILHRHCKLHVPTPGVTPRPLCFGLGCLTSLCVRRASGRSSIRAQPTRFACFFASVQLAAVVDPLHGAKNFDALCEYFPRTRRRHCGMSSTVPQRGGGGHRGTL